MKLLTLLTYRHWRLLTIISLAVISLLSLWPNQMLPAVPGSDKTHHLIAYAALAFPTALRKPDRWYYLITGMALWSGAIELIQPFVNRYGEWLDMAANCTGLLLGCLLAQFVRHCTRQTEGMDNQHS